MKLSELYTRGSDRVIVDDGTPVQRFTTALGYAMDLEQGIVTVTGKGIATARLVPVANVAFMTPDVPLKLAKAK